MVSKNNKTGKGNTHFFTIVILCCLIIFVFGFIYSLVFFDEHKEESNRRYNSEKNNDTHIIDNNSDDEVLNNNVPIEIKILYSCLVPNKIDESRIDIIAYNELKIIVAKKYEEKFSVNGQIYSCMSDIVGNNVFSVGFE